jgi:hypothetical protein
LRHDVPLWTVARVIRDALLAVHICAGVGGLLVGPIAMRAPKRRGLHTRAGLAYQVAVAVLAATALGLVVLAPGRLWGLGVIAVATEAAALAGLAVERRRAPGWLSWHIGLMCGSYISFVTAALVVNWASPLAWILPTIVGTPLIAAATAHAGRHPVPTARPSEA